ncbi:MAG: amidohydrolase family protein [Bryobacteraceae bacterium]|nr:amidohydrolase family protein [Bryobacteraceae bacterium]
MRKNLFAAFLAALAALFVAWLPAPADSVTWTAIRDARIVTVSGPVIEKGTVLIRNGVIAAVGAQVDVPASAWVIDGSGLTVYPGLIDALSSWGLPQAAQAQQQAAARGAQPPQQPPQPQQPQQQQQQPQTRSWGPQDRPGTLSWVRAADQVQPSDPRLGQARNAGFTTAVVFPRQGIVAGHGAVVNLGGKTAGEMVVTPDAGLYLALRPSGYTGFPSTPMGIMAYFRQLWLDAEHYRQALALYASDPVNYPRPAYDRAVEGVLGAKRVLLPAEGPVQMERMLKLAADLKTPAVLYGVVRGYEMAQRLKEAGTPAILNVRWPARDRDADPEQEESYRELLIRDLAPTSPAALSAAGVRWAVSSEGMDTPRAVLRALKQSIDRGLKREDALRALTLNAAEIFGVADRLGSIERGKIANLVVATGDLFDDSTRVRMVFIDGVRYLPEPELPTPPAGAPGRGPTSEEGEEQ